MEWTVNQIDDYSDLHYREVRALRLRKKSNRYTCFIRVAFRVYKDSDTAAKRRIIHQITGERMSPTAVQVRLLVSRVWATMNDVTKMPGKEDPVIWNTFQRQG